MAKDPGRLWKRKSREVLAPPLEESGFDDAAAAFGDDDIEMDAEVPAGAASGAAGEDEDGAAADALSSRALEGAAGVADALSSHTPQSPAGVADALSSRAELENADVADALSSQVEHVDVSYADALSSRADDMGGVAEAVSSLPHHEEEPEHEETTEHSQHRDADEEPQHEETIQDLSVNPWTGMVSDWDPSAPIILTKCRYCGSTEHRYWRCRKHTSNRSEHYEPEGIGQGQFPTSTRYLADPNEPVNYERGTAFSVFRDETSDVQAIHQPKRKSEDSSSTGTSSAMQNESASAENATASGSRLWSRKRQRKIDTYSTPEVTTTPYQAELEPSAADALSSREGIQDVGAGSIPADAVSSQDGSWEPDMGDTEMTNAPETESSPQLARGPRVPRILQIAQRNVTHGPKLEARGNPGILADHQFQWGSKAYPHVAKALERPTTAVKGKTPREQAEQVLALLAVRPLPCIYSAVAEIAKGSLVSRPMIEEAAKKMGETGAIVCSDLLDHGEIVYDIQSMEGCVRYEFIPSKLIDTRGYKRFWHGSKLQTLWSVLYHGKLKGSNNLSRGEAYLGGKPGIYTHDDQGLPSCWNYVVHQELGMSGVLHAIIYELRCPENLAKKTPRNPRAAQFTLPEESAVLTAVWIQSVEVSNLTTSHWIMMSKGKKDPQVSTGTTRWVPALEYSPVDETLIFGGIDKQPIEANAEETAAQTANVAGDRYISPLLAEAIEKVAEEAKGMQELDIDNKINEWASAVMKFLDPLLPGLRGERAETMFATYAPAVIVGTKLRLIGDVLTSIMIEEMVANKTKPPVVRHKLVDCYCILVSDSINRFSRSKGTIDNMIQLTWDVSGLVDKREWGQYKTDVDKGKAPWMKYSAVAGATITSMCLTLEDIMRDMPNIEEQKQGSTAEATRPTYVLIYLTGNEFCDNNNRLVGTPQMDVWLGALHRIIDLIQKKANRSLICIGGDAKMWELGPNFDTWADEYRRVCIERNQPYTNGMSYLLRMNKANQFHFLSDDHNKTIATEWQSSAFKFLASTDFSKYDGTRVIQYKEQEKKRKLDIRPKPCEPKKPGGVWADPELVTRKPVPPPPAQSKAATASSASSSSQPAGKLPATIPATGKPPVPNIPGSPKPPPRALQEEGKAGAVTTTANVKSTDQNTEPANNSSAADTLL